MRTAQKNEILDTVGTLHAAHAEIKGYIEKSNIAAAAELLVLCQQSAMEIGNLIDVSEKGECVTISYLEGYCELVYQIHEELCGDTNHVNTAAKHHKNLEKYLLKIENSIKNDIPIRKEVAFFPYKASMWDSLESVYLAAREDPECDAYCVPIPYYDKNPDGSFGVMHYEGREYPKNIEVVDYRTYEFEKRKPDEIYIHNPYDNCNYVTSVMPRFYSGNLKKYTDCLVYIPYCMYTEVDPNDSQVLEMRRAFYWVPGVINADKVILQSENMKKVFIKIYLQEAKKYGFTGKHLDENYLNQKFLGTGSPKCDRATKIKKEDLDIPDEWQKIIKKPDGTDKKIVFYNITVGAFLDQDEKALEKIRKVLAFFYDNKEVLALLWRPHPLLKSTMFSMRPRLYPVYNQIADEYKKAGWGIFDDSADLDRAVVLCDMYYCDGHSVEELCRKAGKKVICQIPGTDDDLENLKRGIEELFPYSSKISFTSL